MVQKLTVWRFGGKGDVKLMTGVVLLLVIPMIILNPLGRSAFLGYYAGVIATWAA